MTPSTARRPHGAFGIAPFDTYALITFSGSWNAECVEYFSAMLRKHSGVHAGRRRSSLVDCRKWNMVTSDGQEALRDLSAFLSETYASLNAAFILEPPRVKLAAYFLEKGNIAEGTDMTWGYFSDLTEARDWLIGRGYALPAIEWSDFPAAVEPPVY